jgi:transposase
MKVLATDLTKEGKNRISLQLKEMRNQGASWQTTSKISPVSLTTTRRWLVTNMEQKSQEERQSHPRSPVLLHSDEIEQFIQSARDERKLYRPMKLNWSRKRIKEITNRRVEFGGFSYISRLFNKNGWRSWKTQSRNRKELRPTLQNEVDLFREEICRFVLDNSIPKSRVWMMDETGL